MRTHLVGDLAPAPRGRPTLGGGRLLSFIAAFGLVWATAGSSWRPAPVAAGNGQPPVSLALTPAAITVAPGASFSLNVALGIEPGSHAVSFVALGLGFDPAVLQVTAFAPTTSLPQTLETSLDSGTAALAASTGSSPTQAIQQSATIATVTFTAIGATGAVSPVNWTRADALSISANDEASENVVGSPVGASVCVSASGSSCQEPPEAPELVAPDDGAFVEWNRSDPTLYWDAVPGATAYYAENWRDPTAEPRFSGWQPATSWRPGYLSLGYAYSWRVKSRNANGVEGPWSETREFAVRPRPPGPAPYLLLRPVSCTELDVFWEIYRSWDTLTGDEGIRVYRDGVPIADVGPNVWGFTDVGLTPGSDHTYFVTAFRADVESSPGWMESVTMPACDTPTPEPTATATIAPTATLAPSPTPTATTTPSPTATIAPTATWTPTSAPTATRTPSPAPTATPTRTPTVAATPGIVLSQARGIVGTTVVANVSGFAPGTAVAITFNGKTVGSVTMASGGVGTATFAVPALPLGVYPVTAFAGSRTAAATYEVVPRIKVSPNSAARGVSVSISLRGYGKRETVRIRWRRGTSYIEVGRVVTSNSGSANTTVLVPSWAPDGLTAIRGDGTIGRAQTNAFSVVGGQFRASAAVEPPTPTPMAAMTTEPPRPYTIASSQSSAEPSAAMLAYDDRPETHWTAVGPDRPVLVLDLGSVVPIASIRWLFGVPSLADEMQVQWSTDAVDWMTLTEAGGADAGVWQILPVAIQSRYVRFAFPVPLSGDRVGGIAEVQLWPEVSASPQPGSQVVRPLPTSTPTPEPTMSPTTVTVALSPTAIVAPTPPATAAPEIPTEIPVVDASPTAPPEPAPTPVSPLESERGEIPTG